MKKDEVKKLNKQFSQQGMSLSQRACIFYFEHRDELKEINEHLVWDLFAELPKGNLTKKKSYEIAKLKRYKIIPEPRKRKKKEDNKGEGYLEKNNVPYYSNALREEVKNHNKKITILEISILYESTKDSGDKEGLAKRIKESFPNVPNSWVIEATKWKRYSFWLKTEEERSIIKEKAKVRYEKNPDKKKAATKKLIDYTKNIFGGCSICGYSRSKRALEFHHIDPKEKESVLCRIRDPKLAVIEIKKCTLLCSNCHREFHDGLITQLQILQAGEKNQQFFKKIDSFLDGLDF